MDTEIAWLCQHNCWLAQACLSSCSLKLATLAFVSFSDGASHEEVGDEVRHEVYEEGC